MSPQDNLSGEKKVQVSRAQPCKARGKLALGSSGAYLYLYLCNGQREGPEGIEDCGAVAAVSARQGALQLPNKEIWGEKANILRACLPFLSAHALVLRATGRSRVPWEDNPRSFLSKSREWEIQVFSYRCTYPQSDCLPSLDTSSTSAVPFRHPWESQTGRQLCHTPVGEGLSARLFMCLYVFSLWC